MSETAALPVALDFADADLGADVARFVESALGWQVVVDGPDLPARLRLTDRADRPHGAVLVLGTAAPIVAVDRARRAGARAVLSWPASESALRDLVPPPDRRLAADVLTVRGAAAGVGTTTVALCVAALHAWQGRRAWLVAGRDGLRIVGADGSPTAWEVPMLPGLHVARHLRDVAHLLAEDDVVVVDVGVCARGHLLVARPDRHLVAALRHPARWVVTVGPGALHTHERDTVVGGRPSLHLRWDFRVARAGLRGRLPGGLPGRLVADLHHLVSEPMPRGARP